MDLLKLVFCARVMFQFRLVRNFCTMVSLQLAFT